LENAPTKIISKREENKAVIKQRLLEVSFKLFSTKGLEQTTVSDIVEAAGIGRGTFYNYFNDVRDIFASIVEVHNQEITAAINQSKKQATSFYDLLFISFKSYLEHVSKPELEAFLSLNNTYIREASYGSESIKTEMHNLRTDLREQKGRGQFKEEKEIKLLSYILIGAPLEMYLNLRRSGMNYTTDEMADFLAKLFTKGMKG